MENEINVNINCFWCNEKTGLRIKMDKEGQVAKLFGLEEDSGIVVNYETCSDCTEKWMQGYAIISSTAEMNENHFDLTLDGRYPTGMVAIVGKDWITAFIEEPRRSEILAQDNDYILVEESDFLKLFGQAIEEGRS